MSPRRKRPEPPRRGRPLEPGALRREGYRVSLLLSEEDLGDLDRAADKAGVSRAEAVREAVREWTWARRPR